MENLRMLSNTNQVSRNNPQNNSKNMIQRQQPMQKQQMPVQAMQRQMQPQMQRQQMPQQTQQMQPKQKLLQQNQQMYKQAVPQQMNQNVQVKKQLETPNNIVRVRKEEHLLTIFDTKSINKITIVMFSKNGCSPCVAIKPWFIEFSRHNPAVQCVYICTDDYVQISNFLEETLENTYPSFVYYYFDGATGSGSIYNIIKGADPQKILNAYGNTIERIKQDAANQQNNQNDDLVEDNDIPCFKSSPTEEDEADQIIEEAQHIINDEDDEQVEDHQRFAAIPTSVAQKKLPKKNMLANITSGRKAQNRRLPNKLVEDVDVDIADSDTDEEEQKFMQSKMAKKNTNKKTLGKQVVAKKTLKKKKLQKKTSSESENESSQTESNSDEESVNISDSDDSDEAPANKPKKRNQKKNKKSEISNTAGQVVINTPEDMQRMIIQSFNPLMYGIDLSAWNAMSNEDKQKIFQKHAMMVHAKMNMMANANGQSDRLQKLQQIANDRNSQQNMMAAAQKAAFIQQHQLNMMQ
jgi:thiol-disulfide isomerase/thioredoxin